MFNDKFNKINSGLNYHVRRFEVRNFVFPSRAHAHCHMGVWDMASNWLVAASKGYHDT